MSRAVLSIGSNIGDSLAHLQAAVDGFHPHVVAVSSVYSTAPWGGVAQQDILNAVVVVSSPDIDCFGWLRLGQELERKSERVREVRWGPRTLDIDIITCDNIMSEEEQLILPHPRAWQRAFVLVPWLEIENDAELLVNDRLVPIQALLNALDESERDGIRLTSEHLRW